jgi:hypothetical protein
MTNDMGEWQSAGVILYTATNHIPRLKIITKEHTYEIQAHKFHPIMRVFAVLVDGEFHASIHDSLDRFLELDEISKSEKCSKREQALSDEIESLKGRIQELLDEKAHIQEKYNDARVIIFDGV